MCSLCAFVGVVKVNTIHVTYLIAVVPLRMILKEAKHVGILMF